MGAQALISAYSIQSTGDGGYVVAGTLNGNLWVLKLDARGGILWQRDYGATGLLGMKSAVRPTPDGGGNLVWQREYGDGAALDVQPTPDGGHVVAGYSRSYSGMEPTYRVLVLKLDARGDVGWQQTYGGTSDVGAYSVRATADGGYVVAGFATVSGTVPQRDAWVLKLNSSGAITGCPAMAESNAVAADHGAHRGRRSHQFGHQLHTSEQFGRFGRLHRHPVRTVPLRVDRCFSPEPV